MSHIIIWLCAIVFIEAVVEIEVASELFVKVRAKVSRLPLVGWYLNGLFSCGYCLSVWVSAAVALAIPTKIIPNDTGSLFDIPHPLTAIANYLLIAFILHRLSNIWHEMVHRWLQRMPYLLSINNAEPEIDTWENSNGKKEKEGTTSDSGQEDNE